MVSKGDLTQVLLDQAKPTPCEGPAQLHPFRGKESGGASPKLRLPPCRVRALPRAEHAQGHGQPLPACCTARVCSLGSANCDLLGRDITCSSYHLAAATFLCKKQEGWLEVGHPQPTVGY